MSLSKFSKILVALAFALVLSQSARAADAQSPVGVWIANDGKAHVSVAPCKDNQDHICGTVIWVAEPIDPETGKPKLDKRNSDKSLRSRPVIGMSMLDMSPDDDGIWRGNIYNGQDGNTYNATLRLNDGKIDVQGCVFFGLLCKTQTWERFAE